LARFRFALAASGALACLAAPAMAEVPKAAIRGEMPGELRTAIEKAVGESKAAVDSRLEARRRARDAAEDAIAVLRSEGYYDYEVFPDIGEGERPQPIVTVEPGPRFHIQNPRVTWVGSAPAADVAQAGVAGMQLKDGDPGRAADVVAAEGRVVAIVEKRGYADAEIEPREVIVDHADDSVQPEFRINSGGLVHLDGVDLRTKGRTNPRWVAGLAPWKAGEVYDPDDVAELEQRLLDAGVYDSVTVALAPKDQLVNGERPVVVSLADRPRGTIELGAGYSTSEGVGVDGRWLRYNRLGRADTTTITARIAEIEYRLDGQIAFPHWRKPKRTLTLGAAVFANNTDAYDDQGVSARVDLTTRLGRNIYRTSYRTIGLSLDATRTDERTPVQQQTDFVTLTLLGALSQDRSDDPLDPKRGWKAEIRAEPTASVGDKNLLYFRAVVQGSAYMPLGKEANTVAAVRLRLGTVTGVSLLDVPASRRLYAGGGGSVRGYAYQGVGPRFPDNTPQGGLSLFEASGELRQKITDKWGAALFYDVGAVGEQPTPSFSRVSTGVGVGVRYNLGFAPIRADIAVPLNKREGDPSYQVYVSIGQSF
jgi:translocation and assembly module TamA